MVGALGYMSIYMDLLASASKVISPARQWMTFTPVWELWTTKPEQVDKYQNPNPPRTVSSIYATSV